MGPFRFAILAVLFYFLWRLVFPPKVTQKKDQNPETSHHSNDEVADDVLVEDPICHTFVAKKQAESIQHGDHTYYFCSTECRKTFINNNKGA